jgi:hypothetical protein
MHQAPGGYFEPLKGRGQACAALLQRPVVSASHFDRFADRDRDRAERLRDRGPVPAAGGPGAAGLEVKWQDRVPGCAREPDNAQLHDAARSTRSIHGKRHGLTRAHVSGELHQRPRTSARGRAARSPVPESSDDAGDPLAVEVPARDHDDLSVLPEQRRREDASVPEGKYGLLARRDDRLVMRKALNAPPICRTKRPDNRCANGGNQSRLAQLPRRQRRVSRQSSFAQCQSSIANAIGNHQSSIQIANRQSEIANYMPSYCGPPPPSGGTQSMIWYGSMMSHVLQCTQFDALICSFFRPSPASTIS